MAIDDEASQEQEDDNDDDGEDMRCSSEDEFGVMSETIAIQDDSDESEVGVCF